MTIPTLRVLKAFLEDPAEPHYGLELGKVSRLPGGTIYPILARLEAAGWISGEWEQIDEAKEGRRARRYYILTKVGAALARNELEALLPEPTGIRTPEPTGIRTPKPTGIRTPKPTGIRTPLSDLNPSGAGA